MRAAIDLGTRFRLLVNSGGRQTAASDAEIAGCARDVKPLLPCNNLPGLDLAVERIIRVFMK